MNPALPDPQSLLANAGWVRRLARSLVRDAHEAEDLVQDAMVVALEKAPAGTGPRQRGAAVPREWFAAVLRNLASKSRRSAARRDQREASAARPESQPPTDDRVARAALHQSVVRAVLELDEPYRTAVLMRYLDELPPRRIAKELDVPVSTVHTRIARGIERLRAKLDQSEGGREAWLPGLLALCEVPAPVIGTILGGLVVSTEIKVILAAAVTLVALWGGMNLLGEPAESAEESTARVESAVATPAPPQATEEQGESSPEGAVAGIEREEVTTEPSVTPVASEARTRLLVKLVAAETGAPLSHVSVILRPAGQPVTDPDRLEELSFARGTVEFDVPADQALTLDAIPSRWNARPTALEVEPLAAGESRELEVALVTEADGHFFARVVDESGEPIEGAEVRMYDLDTWSTANGGWSEPGIAHIRTDADGRFDLAFLSWRPSVLRLRAEGFGDCMANLSMAHPLPDEARRIELMPEAQLDLIVLGAGGVPFEGLAVRAKTPTFQLLEGQPGRWNYSWLPDARLVGQTDVSGKLSLDGLAAGMPITVEVHDGATLVHREEGLHLAAGEHRELIVELREGTVLTGVVHDPDGAGVSGLEVWLQKGHQDLPAFFMMQAETFARTTTDKSGRFRFDGLAAGSWLVGPAPTRQLFQQASPDAWAGLAQPLELVEGEREHEVELTVHKGLFLRGRAEGADGEPVTGAYVTAMTGEVWGASMTMVDAEGRFAVGPLVPGTYVVNGRVAAGGNHTQSKGIAAQAGDEDLVLVFARGGSIAGRVLRPSGKEDVGFHVIFQRADGLGMMKSWQTLDDTADEFVREGLDPGAYNVIARTNDGGIAVRTGVEVSVDQAVTGVDLVIEPGASLAVWFEGEHEWATIELWQGDVFLARGNFVPGDRWYQVVPYEAVGLRGESGRVTVRLTTPEGERSEHTVVLEREGETEAGIKLD